MEVELYEPFMDIFDELFYKGKKEEEKKRGEYVWSRRRGGSFLSRRKSRFVLWSAQRVCRRSIYMLRKSAVKSRVEFAF